MKLLKNRVFASVTTLIVILACVFYARSAASAELISVTSGNWVADEANVLSSETESTLRSMNASFDSAYSSVIAVATVNSTKGWDLEEYCVELGEAWGLGGHDFIVIFDIGADTAYMYAGSYIGSFDASGYLDDYVAADFYDRDYDSAILNLFAAMEEYYTTEYSKTSSDDSLPTGSSADSYYGYYGYNSTVGYNTGFGGVFAMSIILIIFVALLILGGIGGGRRRPPRGGGMWGFFFGGPRPPMGGGHRPPMGGGFGGGMGGFGGGHGGSLGGGRVGGFSGGHGGGMGGGFGGGHGGGMGGGRR